MTMIPISLITGFLGSGKTTLLKRIVHDHEDERLVYLVNEFSATDVDGAIAEEEGADTITVLGGSIFCKCKVTDFIHYLKAIPEEFDSPETPLAGVVIEASGMADPRVIQTMLRETRLDQIYQLRSIITVVDPGSFHKLLVTLPNIKAQVESATIAVVNKVDLSTESQVVNTRQKLTEINPDLTIHETTFANVSLPIFKEASHSKTLVGDYAKCVDPNFGKFELAIDDDFDLPNLKATVTPYLDDIYRIKGFVPHGDRIVYLDYSKAGWIVNESSRAHYTNLVLIVKGAAVNKLKHLLNCG